MKRIILVFGLLSGTIVSVIMAISMIIIAKNPGLGMGTGSMVVGYLSMIIAFSLIFVAVKNYRDKHLEGFISLGKAFKIGFLIALIASTMYVIMWALVYNFVFPDFMDRYAAQMMKGAEGSSTIEMEEKAAQMLQYKEMYKNPLFFTLMTYAEILPVGLLVSLITALVLKKKRKEEMVVG